MDLFEAMRTTFACRDFTADPVSDATLYEIFENARFAPSGGNRQGNKAIIIRDAATKAELSKLSEPGARRYIAQVKAGESPWNTVHPTRVTDADIAATPAPAVLTRPFIAAPVVIVFTVDLGLVASLDQFLDRVGVISGGSVYPFIWNVLLAARAAGLGGTITTLAVAQEARIRDLLGIPENHAVAAVMPLGRPAKQLTKLKRNPVEEIVTLERFDGQPLGRD